MQYLVSVIFDRDGLATEDEQAAIDVFNDRLVRHEVLRDRVEVKDHRRRAVAVVR
jgi:hypothetical protein